MSKENQKANKPNYMEELHSEVDAIMQKLETEVDEVKTSVFWLLEKSAKESFKNGIEVGKKNRQKKTPYKRRNS